MFFRILKRDLKKKKGVNIILFLFILLAVVFVASSVNNVLVVTNATQYSLEKAKMPDDGLYTFQQDSADRLEEWLKGEGADYISEYARENGIMISGNNILSFGGRDGEEYDIVDMILLQAQGDSFMIAFDQDGNPLEMEDGMIGMPADEMERMSLKPGDEITFAFGDYERTFTLTEPIVDPVFGGDFIGTLRLFVSEEEYERISAAECSVVSMFSVMTEDVDSFSKAVNSMELDIGTEFSRSLVEKTYILPVIISGIMIIVGVCLIIIAFLVLRFTIMVTLQEEYREIGIMKAIGIPGKGIMQLYLIKNAAISFVAAAAGCLISIPVSSGMIKFAASGMMMQDGAANLLVNVLCSALVMFIVIGFCYLTVSRLKGFSAIRAIRGGSLGERFRKKAILPLYKRQRIGVPYFLAWNDIWTALKRYVVMILTFMMGTILMILCSNMITTFESEEMAKNFLLDPSCQVFITAESILENEAVFTADPDMILQKIEETAARFEEKGYDAKIHTFAFYVVYASSENDTQDKRSVMAALPIGTDAEFVETTDGTLPVVENEIVVSEIMMDVLGLSIGDSLHLTIGGKDYEMLICGTFSNYMNMGKSILLSDKLDLSDAQIMASWFYQVDIENRGGEDLLDELQKEFPEYVFENSFGVVNRQIGNAVLALAAVRIGVVILMCAISMLITVLMMKVFIMGERGQIAMLRSVGFSIRAVRLWQTARMGMVLFLGVALGILLSIPLSRIIQPLFGIMGATSLKVQVNVLDAYVLCPLILLICVETAAYLCSSSIRKMNLMDINNIE